MGPSKTVEQTGTLPGPAATPASRLHVLPPADWRTREAAHAERVRRYADPYLARRSAGRKHPVEDFLFTYYTQKPGQLLRLSLIHI